MDTGTRRGGARIDVTPMADVVIVLLLIFMVMTPAIATGGLSLPTALRGESGLPRPALRLGADGRLELEGGPPWPREQLVVRLREELSRRPAGERVVALRADRAVDYARVREALALCREAGAEHVALATWPAGAAVGR